MASPNAQATPQNGPQAPKAQGYNKLARLMGPNSEMAIFRRFGSLNMMNLLYLQAELMELERKYEVAYCEDAQSSVESVSNFCRDFTKLRASKGTGYSDQLDQLLNISEKLEKYNTALCLAADVNKLNRPNREDFADFRGWLATKELGGNFLRGTEYFTWDSKHDGDFVVLSPEPTDGEPMFSSLSALPLNLFHRCFGGQRRKPDEETGVFIYKDVYVRRTNKLIVTTIASLLPIVAIVVLYAVHGTWRRIYVMIAFTALFGIAMATSSARKSEIFAATAAFAAVEVVFIGSVSSGG